MSTAAGGSLDRTTSVGRFLRRTSLDELPQLFNVLRGEMSLIGPRPERVAYAEAFEQTVHGYSNRHRVKSGLTGWAQVSGLRGATSLADRVEWDNHYIEHWSPWLDLEDPAVDGSAAHPAARRLMRFRTTVLAAVGALVSPRPRPWPRSPLRRPSAAPAPTAAPTPAARSPTTRPRPTPTWRPRRRPRRRSRPRPRARRRRRLASLSPARRRRRRSHPWRPRLRCPWRRLLRSPPRRRPRRAPSDAGRAGRPSAAHAEHAAPPRARDPRGSRRPRPPHRRAADVPVTPAAARRQPESATATAICSCCRSRSSSITGTMLVTRAPAPRARWRLDTRRPPPCRCASARKRDRAPGLAPLARPDRRGRDRARRGRVQRRRLRPRRARPGGDRRLVGGGAGRRAGALAAGAPTRGPPSRRSRCSPPWRCSPSCPQAGATAPRRRWTRAVGRRSTSACSHWSSLAARAGSAVRWSDGIAAGIAAVGIASLASRLFPGLGLTDSVSQFFEGEVYLSYPLDYWNGLAAFVALSFPLLLRAALDAPNAWTRAARWRRSRRSPGCST